ncbi:MAG: WYL domain-containing protein [Caldilineaceae bacterium]
MDQNANFLRQLTRLFGRLPAHDLRAVATRLGVRRRGHERKDDWVAAIVAIWQQPQNRQAALQRLSPTARAALLQLCTAHKLPAAIFWADYGPLRRPQSAARTANADAAPWVAPATVSEELYYSGLLHGVEHANIQRTEHVQPPMPLCPHLLLTAVETAAAPAGPAAPHAWPLLHDLAQYLIFHSQHADLSLLHGRWLAPTQLKALNARLLQPAAAPLRSHKSAPRLCWLAFLAQAAHLHSADGLTAAAWSWLAAAPATQLLTLWLAWQRAPAALRRTYAQPDAYLGGADRTPWPQPLIHLLAQQNDAFSAARLADQILGAADALLAYFAAYLPDSATLTHIVAELLAGPLTSLGLVQRQSAAPSAAPPAQIAYTLAPAGHWLLHPALPAPALTSAPDEPAAARTLTAAHTAVAARWVESTAAAPGAAMSEARWLTPPYLQLEIAAAAPFDQQAHLAAFADDGRLLPPPDAEHGPRHLWLLHRDALARAAAADRPFVQLTDALAALELALPAAHMAALQRWHEEGRTLRLRTLPLLQSRQPDQMAALWQDRRLRPLLQELLSPTTATLNASTAEAADLLRRAGHWVAHPAAPAALPARAAALDEEENADPAATLIGPDAGLLWLASQLYQQLGAHLTLPAPMPSPTLDRLWRHIDPYQQALLHSQLDQLLQRLQNLLDGYTHSAAPYTPEPVDPEQWLPPINAAIAAGRSLTIHYYSAGRNLLTRRTIDPYWIETRHGIPYVRAYCHQSARDRLFRLDRVQEVEE